jgi:hypothetical protein
MPIGSTASTHPPKWELRSKDFKNYFHFDTRHSRAVLETTAQNDIAVTQHSFFPLMLFKEEWVKFRKNGLIKRKIRPLRYSSRLDASIYAYHRYKLSIEYEKKLVLDGITDVPIAYRKISKPSGKGNKCNIDFAYEAFDFIRQCGNCDVTIIDISSFFESLNHEKLKMRWEYVVGRGLDDAELAVWRAVTKYSVVDRDSVYERLKMYEKSGGTTRKEQKMRNIDKLKAQGKRQLCSPSDFRHFIAGANPKYPSLIQKNTKDVGIPQGTPISDILANIYLIDFDKKVARWTRKRHGKYFRYCDDIIIILPRKNGQSHELAKKYVDQALKNDDPKLIIQDKKIAVGRFVKISTTQFYTHLSGAASFNGIEYLGFQYDGLSVQIKNSTMSNAWRKLKKGRMAGQSDG